MNTQRKRITPNLKAQILAMIAAGYSMVSIAEQLSIPYETIRKIKKRSKISKGELQDSIVEVQKNILIEALSSDFVKQQAASLIRDEVIVANKVKAKTNQLIDLLPNNAKSPKEIGSIARALSAIATAQKLSSDSLRATLKLGAQPEIVEELPQLIVREMLQEEVDEIRAKQEIERLKLEGY